jgi:tetratricopeptide (TPR) repeat protein
LVSVTVLVFLWGRSRPYLPVGWLWYLGTLIPVIGIVQVGSQAMADRYTYIPLIGLFIIIAWGLPDLLPTRRGYRLCLAGVTAMAMVAVMTLTFQQVGYWKNSATLFAHTLRVTRDNALAHTHLGLALSQSGRLRDAIAEYRKALALSPIQPRIHNNLGVALYRSGEISAAVAHFRAALAVRPDFIDARHNLRRVTAVKDRLPGPPDKTRNRKRADDHVQR